MGQGLATQEVKVRVSRPDSIMESLETLDTVLHDLEYFTQRLGCRPPEPPSPTADSKNPEPTLCDALMALPLRMSNFADRIQAVTRDLKEGLL
jgi:hypothetical protein